jgi:hypothetical protein
MKNKISLLLSLTLISLVPQSQSYTKADLEHLQSLTSMGALCFPITKIAEGYIPTPNTNTYQEGHAVATTKKTLKNFGQACAIINPILAAATESDENLLSIINECLLTAYSTHPDLFSAWNTNDCKNTALKLTTILSTKIGNNISDKLIKKLFREKGLRIIRRVFRVIARSAIEGGAKVGVHYINTTFLGSNLPHLYAEKFFETAAVIAVKELFYEICGEILAMHIKESKSLEEIIEEQIK